MVSSALRLVLFCPKCGGKLSAVLQCEQCHYVFQTVAGVPSLIADTLPPDISLNERKWSKLYRSWTPIQEDVKEFLQHFREIDAYFRKHSLGQRGPGRFLELGCGRSYLAAEMAQRGYDVFGIDVSPIALSQSQEYFHIRHLHGNFVHGEITHLPFRDDTFDFTHGGGTIEHVRDTQAAISELYRVTAPGGATFQTVPYASLGAIVYRQQSGNIPDIPVLKQLAEFIHQQLLAGRLMQFGYEKSFLAGTLRRLFINAGWGDVIVRHFDVDLKFERVTSPVVRSLLKRLARHRWFWPMVYVVARKT